jgi:hypothetical protein
MMYLVRVFFALVAYAASIFLFGLLYGVFFEGISIKTPLLFLFFSVLPIVWFVWAGFAVTYLASLSLSSIDNGWLLSSRRMAVCGFVSGLGTTMLLAAMLVGTREHPALSDWRDAVIFVLIAGISGSFGWWVSAALNNAFARSKLPQVESASSP